MPIAIDHVAIPARDPHGAASFLAELLGLAAKPEGPDGEFQCVVLDAGAMLLFSPVPASGLVPAHHVALRVGKEQLDGVVRRLHERGLPFGNDPDDLTNARSDDPLGGEGRVYFVDPEGHLFEVCAPPTPKAT